MELIKPAIGLMFWAAVAFSFLLFVLRRFAWNPILKAVKSREVSIREALESAEEAKKEVGLLRESNENLMKQALSDRDAILEEAKKMKISILEEAKSKATQEYEEILANAREVLEQERKSAINAIKAQIIEISIEVAKKVLEKELENKESQDKFVSKLVEKMEF